MGMSTHVIGFRPPDDKWKKMKHIYDACMEGGIDVPDEVDNFFNGEPPDDQGVEVDLDDCLTEYDDKDYRAGYELDVKKLPKDVTIIRFYNSW